MTRNDDFDQTLEAWLRRTAPSQAPDRVLDAALQRVADQSQQRGWLHRLSGGTPMNTILRVAAVAAALAFAAFIGYQLSGLPRDVGNSPVPSPSQTTTPSTEATPVADAALVLRLMGGGEAGRVHLMTVLDDGRIITSAFEGAPYVERRLSAVGVQQLRDELDATGLALDTTLDYSPVANPGVEPPGYGGAGPSLEVGQPGGSTVIISWFLFGDTEQDYFQPQPEAEALEALLARLTSIDDWLPASAWADADPTPYAPPTYRIYVYTSQWGGSLDDLPVEATTVSWPLDDGTDTYANLVESLTQGPEFSLRCRAASATEAAPVRQALENAGATPQDYSIVPGPTFELGHRATSRVVTVTLEPVLPLADPGCDPEITF